MNLRAIRRRTPILIPLVVVLVLTSGGALAAIESDVVSNYGQGVWWAVSLMSTVGFAGETPRTVGGQLISGSLMVFGFATLSLVTASFASLLVVEEEAPKIDTEMLNEADVATELRRVRIQLESLEAQLARRR